MDWDMYRQSSAKTTYTKLQISYLTFLHKSPHNKVSNYCRAKVLSFPKGKIRQNQEYFRGVGNSAQWSRTDYPSNTIFLQILKVKSLFEC